MEDHESAGWKVLKRAKAKEQTEAEQLFSQYCKPKSGFWRSLNWRQPALAILSSGIFAGNALKGHARHKKNYPIDLGDLIYDLVETGSARVFSPHSSVRFLGLIFSTFQTPHI